MKMKKHHQRMHTNLHYTIINVFTHGRWLAREYLRHVQRLLWSGHCVLEEEEGNVSLVTQLDKMAAFE